MAKPEVSVSSGRVIVDQWGNLDQIFSNVLNISLKGYQRREKHGYNFKTAHMKAF